MSKEDILKSLIIDAIKSNPSAKKKFDALKENKLSGILQCYKDSGEEYIDRSGEESDEIKKKVNDFRRRVTQENIIFRPEQTRNMLTSWLGSDVWYDVLKKVKHRPDDVDFKIKLQEVLDDTEIE